MSFFLISFLFLFFGCWLLCILCDGVSARTFGDGARAVRVEVKWFRRGVRLRHLDVGAGAEQARHVHTLVVAGDLRDCGFVGLWVCGFVGL